MALVLLAMLVSSIRFIENTDDFGVRVSGYYHEKIGNVLFLHTDKTIYIPNESIWFKAYILDSEPLQNEVLYIRLLNEQKQIVLQKEFPVYDIRSHGNMLVPITTAPGQYQLVAYTDKMISFDPKNVFVGRIQIIKDLSSELRAEALIADRTAFSAGKKPEILVKVSDNDHEVEKARGTYRIYTSGKKTIVEGKFTTGHTGIAALNFTYPAINANEELFLQCKVTDKDQSRELYLRLPKSEITVLARCYPEGGHLINGTSNRVLIALTDAGGQPVAAKVSLKSQTGQVTTTTTGADGLASFFFTPDLKKKYSVTITNPVYSRTITFPVDIEPAGYVMRLTGAADHPAILVKNQNMPGKVMLMGRTLTDLKLSKTLTVKSGDSVLVPLPQNDSIDHVVDLGLFDWDSRLQAERLVYLHVPEKYRVTFHFDKTDYSSREKVRAEIRVSDMHGTPVAANLSVAVVAKQALDPSMAKRITQTDLNALSHNHNSTKGINDLNNELIRESLRTGNWSDVLDYQPKGRIDLISNAAGVFGFVSNKKNKKIDLKTLYLYSRSGLIAVPVNSNGSFSVPARDLVTERGDAKYLIVNKEFNDRYDLHIKNYSGDFDARLLTVNISGDSWIYDLPKQSAQLSSMVSGKILAEVTINGKKSSPVTATDLNVREYHSANCNDYVCFYNILNCKNHPNGGSPPVEGEIYVLDGRPVRYHGCATNDDSKKNIYTVKKIELPETFYLPDYAKDPVLTPELQSTIFWDPNLNTPSNGKSTVEFYTSDIRGAFTIVVQGLTVKGLSPVFGESDFMVTQQNGSLNK